MVDKVMVWCSRHKDVLAQNISVSESCGSDACNPPSHHQKLSEGFVLYEPPRISCPLPLRSALLGPAEPPGLRHGRPPCCLVLQRLPYPLGLICGMAGLGELLGGGGEPLLAPLEVLLKQLDPPVQGGNLTLLTFSAKFPQLSATCKLTSSNKNHLAATHLIATQLCLAVQRAPQTQVITVLLLEHRLEHLLVHLLAHLLKQSS